MKKTFFISMTYTSALLTFLSSGYLIGYLQDIKQPQWLVYTLGGFIFFAGVVLAIFAFDLMLKAAKK